MKDTVAGHRSGKGTELFGCDFFALTHACEIGFVHIVHPK